MKLELKTTGPKTAQILLDGHDISGKVTGININFDAREVPIVTLKLVPDNIEVNEDFEVLKGSKELNKDYPLKLSQSEQAFIMAAEQIKNEKAINLTINTPYICDDVMKEIVDKLSKACRNRVM